MNHRSGINRLGRNATHRRATLDSLALSLFKYERIRTTLAKAKETRPLAEKMITLGKKGTLHARRQVLAFVRKEAVVAKVFDDLGPRFGQRPGGYSRIVKLGQRAGDGADLAMLELVGSEFKKKAKKKKDKEKSVKKSK